MIFLRNQASQRGDRRMRYAASIQKLFQLTGTGGSWSLTPMFRFCLCLWLLLCAPLATIPWHAAHGEQKPSAPATTPSGTLSPEQARAALDTLTDPKKRAAVTATLEALIASQANVHPPAAPVTAPPTTQLPPAAQAPPAAASGDAKPAPEGIAIQLAPNSLGAQVLLSASSFLNDTASDLSEGLKTIQSIPLLWGWTVVMATNPLGQQLLRDTGWRLVVVLLLALGVELALRILLRRPMARVLNAGARLPLPPEVEEDAVSRAERGAVEAPVARRDASRDRPARRVGLGLARFGLRMVPVVGLLIAGHMAGA